MEEKVLKRLNRLKKTGVIRDYAIGGAHAVACYLEPVKTLDLDIFNICGVRSGFLCFQVLYQKGTV